METILMVFVLGVGLPVLIYLVFKLGLFIGEHYYDLQDYISKLLRNLK